jgi:hypothetical protein
VLDFPDNQEEAFRKILLKQDNTILEELATKSKNEILTFLVKEQKRTTNSKETLAMKVETEESQKQNIKNERIEQKLSKIKSVFTTKILEKNPDIAEKFKNIDSLKSFPFTEDSINQKEQELQGILQILKQP